MEINFIKQTLNSSVQIYVPTKIKDNIINKEIHKYCVNKVIENMNRIFGGATAQSGFGAWSSPNHGTIKEEVTIVTSSTQQEIIENRFRDVVAIAIWLKIELNQEHIFIQVNQKAFLI